MRCHEYESGILGGAPGTRPTADAETLNAHAAECARCRDLTARLQRLDERLAAAFRARALSPGFEARLRERIRNVPRWSEREQAERSRELQAEYEAGLQRLALFRWRPAVLLNAVTAAGILTMAFGIAWFGANQIAAASNQALSIALLTVAGLVPVGLGMLLAFSLRTGQTGLRAAGQAAG